MDISQPTRWSLIIRSVFTLCVLITFAALAEANSQIALSDVGSGSESPELSLAGDYHFENTVTRRFVRATSSAQFDRVETSASVSDSFTAWRLVRNGDHYHIRNVENGFHLRPRHKGEDSELLTVPASWTGSFTQWTLQAVGDSFQLINRATGKYMSPRSASDSTMIQVSANGASDATLFAIREIIAENPGSTPTSGPEESPEITPGSTELPNLPLQYSPLFDIVSTPAQSQNWRTESDGTTVTFGSGRARLRHESEGLFYVFPAHYFEHRTFGFEIHDNVANGATQIAIFYEPEFAHYQKPECRSAYKNVWRADFNNNSTFEEMKVVESDANGRGEKWVCYITRDAHDGDDGRLEVGEWMEVEFQQFLGRFQGDPEVQGQPVYYTDTYRFKIGEPGISITGDDALEQQIRTGGDATAPHVNAGGVVPQSSVVSSTPTSLTYRDSSDEVVTSPILDGTSVYSTYVVDDEAAVYTSFFREALNIRWDTHNDFLNGRRIFHTRFDTGVHVEPGNPEFTELSGLATDLLVNRSCADCHVNNGRGPSFADPSSAQTRSVNLSSGDLDSRNQPEPHPYFGSVLQNRSLDPNIASEGSLNLGYTLIDGSFADGSAFQLARPDYSIDTAESQGVAASYFSVRMPQTITGLGLLEALDDEDIAEKHDPLDSDSDGISGRVSMVLDTVSREQKIGRFGWKATQASLAGFTAQALNQDIGVNTSLLPTANCGAEQIECTARSGQDVELNDTLLNKLVVYLQALGAPSRRPDEVTSSSVRAGEEIFDDLNCTACHTPSMETGYSHPLAELRGQTIRAYTDLLLHDMGEDLADNLTDTKEYNAEWRTPPLWGLGLTQRVNGHTQLLHDGRARSIEEAILWHGGEASNSAEAYKQLDLSQRQQLLEFLNSL